MSVWMLITKSNYCLGSYNIIIRMKDQINTKKLFHFPKKNWLKMILSDFYNILNTMKGSNRKVLYVISPFLVFCSILIINYCNCNHCKTLVTLHFNDLIDQYIWFNFLSHFYLLGECTTSGSWILMKLGKITYLYV